MKAKIEYRVVTDTVKTVILDGRRIGQIRKLKTGWTYIPNAGLRFKGEGFQTLTDCKKSIEAYD